MPGEGGRLGAHPFHEVAVRAQNPGPVIDDALAGAVELRRQMGFGHREPDRGGDPLAERAGGHLHPRDQSDLRVAGGLRSPLPEVLELFEREIVAGEMKDTVKEHRRMAAGKNEAVTVRPPGIGRVVLEKPRKQHVGHRRQTHRGARVPRVRALDGIDRQGADGGDGKLIDVVKNLGHGASRPSS